MLDFQFVGVVGRVKQKHINHIEPTACRPSTEWFHKWFLLHVTFCLWAKVQTVLIPCFLHPRVFLPCFGKSLTAIQRWLLHLVLGESSSHSDQFLAGAGCKAGTCCVRPWEPDFQECFWIPAPSHKCQAAAWSFELLQELLPADQHCRGSVCSWACTCHFWELTWGGASFIPCPRAVPSKQTCHRKRMINFGKALGVLSMGNP